MRIMVLGVAAGVMFLSAPAAAQDAAQDARERAAAAKAAKEAEARQAAQDCYDQIVTAYLDSDWAKTDQALAGYGKHSLRMTPEQKKDIAYLRTTMPEYRPTWWKYCRSTSNTTFRAKNWGKMTTVRFVPAEKNTWQASIEHGRLTMKLSWNPKFVDNTDPMTGNLAEMHGFQMRHLGEVMVWHQLGYDFMPTALPASQVTALYNGHKMLFDHLQEFYAWSTAMYHASPKARRLSMIVQLDALRGKSSEADKRGAIALGALIVSEILAEPEKWPSVRFQGKAAEKDAELHAIIHIYERITTDWTLAEDRALRDLIGTYFRKNAANVLRKKGEVPLLRRGLCVKLVEADDLEWRPKREAWIAARIAEVPQAQVSTVEDLPPAKPHHKPEKPKGGKKN